MRRRHRTDTRRVERLGEQRVFHERHGVSLSDAPRIFRRGGRALYLLHRYTRRRSQLYTADEGFSFGQGYGFLLAVSGFAGIIVGVVQAVYLHLIVGYANYIDHYVSWMTGLFSRMGGASSSMEGMLSQIVNELQNSPAPSMLKTIWGGVWSCLLFGVVFGLIIAGVIARAPKPFGKDSNE